MTDRNDTDFDGMVRRDLEYIAKRGPITDLKIVALTVVEMITGGCLLEACPEIFPMAGC